MNSQTRRANMAQLQQAVPVASQFPFDDPTIELERMLGTAAPQLGRLGHRPTSVEQMEMDQAPSFTTPPGMEHKASTRPYDPLSKYGLSAGEHLMDIFMGGDTRKAKHAMFVAENPTDFFGEQRPVYDPAIEQAFVPVDMIAGAGLPQMLSAAGKFGLKHSTDKASDTLRMLNEMRAEVRSAVGTAKDVNRALPDIKPVDVASEFGGDVITKRLTPSESKFFNMIVDSEADMLELLEEVPSFKLEKGAATVANKDIENLFKYTEDTVSLNEGYRLPPSFYNGKFTRGFSFDDADIPDFGRLDKDLGEMMKKLEAGNKF